MSPRFVKKYHGCNLRRRGRDGRTETGKEEDRAVSSSTRPTGSWLFASTIAVLILILVAGPIAIHNAFGIDARTPADIARDQLYDDYHLVGVAPDGTLLPPHSHAKTTSEFDLTAGSTTTGVQFGRRGKIVTCTVHVATDDPHSVTADCPS